MQVEEMKKMLGIVVLLWKRYDRDLRIDRKEIEEVTEEAAEVESVY